MSYGILVFGLNGSGKTTLGKELAFKLNYKFMDIEDYYFEHSKVPYSVPRTREECINSLLSDIRKKEKFVLSAVTGDLGREIIKSIKFGIYISAQKDVRLKRIRQRSIERFGDRVKQGGDMYDSEEAFYRMVQNRTSDKVDKWLEMVSLQIIEIDGLKSIDENIDYIMQIYKKYI